MPRRPGGAYFTADLARSRTEANTYSPFALPVRLLVNRSGGAAIISVHPRTSPIPTGASFCAPEITDTEEVTGSNPVSPTSNTPGQTRFARVWCWDQLTCRPSFVGLSLAVATEDLVDGGRPAWVPQPRAKSPAATLNLRSEVGSSKTSVKLRGVAADHRQRAEIAVHCHYRGEPTGLTLRDLE